MYIYLYVCAYMYIECMLINLHAYNDVCVYNYVYILMYAYICICIYVCVCVCV